MTIKACVFDAYGTLYDVQSVGAMLESTYPGHGQYLTQVWRMKQLEYSWLRALMHRYKDFRAVTSPDYAPELTGMAQVTDLM